MTQQNVHFWVFVNEYDYNIGNRLKHRNDVLNVFPNGNFLELKVVD